MEVLVNISGLMLRLNIGMASIVLKTEVTVHAKAYSEMEKLTSARSRALHKLSA